MRRWFSLLGFLAIAHCGGSEVGNPQMVELRVAGIDSTARLNARALSGGLSLTEARLVLSELRFRPLSACASSTQEGNDIRFQGPYVADLLTDSAIPKFGSSEIPSGDYCRIELKLDKLSSDESPVGPSDPIVNHSVIAKGSVLGGTPFKVTLEIDQEFRLENATGFPIGSHGSSIFFLAFDLENWFKGVDLASLPETGGTILVDKDHNQEWLDTITLNIKQSARLFQDQNDDGTLEDSERQTDDILATGGE